jgi:hypothetical protein
MTKIMECKCSHDEQDIMYGKNMRVHNLSEDGRTAYCTVCSPSNRRDKRVPGRPSRNGKLVR